MLATLIRQSRPLLILAVCVSLLGGASNVTLIALVNSALAAEGPARLALALPFTAAVVCAIGAHVGAGMLFQRLSQQAQANLRIGLSRKVLGASYRQFETVGTARVQSALTDHSATLSNLFVALPGLVSNTVVVLGCLAYLSVLSWPVFLGALAAIVLGAMGYHLGHMRALAHLERAATEQDRLFEHFGAMAGGAKELKLNRGKSLAFAGRLLEPTIERLRRERTRGMSIFVAAASWGNLLIYALIGVLLFLVFADPGHPQRITTGFVLVILFMVTPLEVLLKNLPLVNLARVSARRIDELMASLPQEAVPAQARSLSAPRELTLDGITHRYYHEQSDDMFTLGPIALTLRPGEITYLVGGNGSGKTTLAKLLVGLYEPEAGRILLDGQPVPAESRADYRQLFATVFSDFYLFESLLAADSPEHDVRGNALLARLHLQHKVRMRDGAFSTRALSQGQRKRLALVEAYLDERPFLVFDEWAADQDPAFKDVFYREVLPELRRLGKGVLVITHDDRYFPLADRLLRMESGQLHEEAVPRQREYSAA